MGFLETYYYSRRDRFQIVKNHLHLAALCSYRLVSLSTIMSRTANALVCRAAPALRSTVLQSARSPCLRRGFAQETSFPKPLKLKGVLKPLKQFMVTPTVGTEFPEANLVEMLNAPNSDELLRDLAITSKYATDVLGERRN